MAVAMLILVAAAASMVAAVAGSQMKVGSDGGYNGVVVRIADDGSVPEDKCPEILANMQVRRGAHYGGSRTAKKPG